MKKMITLEDDHVLSVCAAIGTQIIEMNKLLQFAREREEEASISFYEKEIAALEQVQEKIRRAKWKW